jgi:hypothetical protein
MSVSRTRERPSYYSACRRSFAATAGLRQSGPTTSFRRPANLNGIDIGLASDLRLIVGLGMSSPMRSKTSASQPSRKNVRPLTAPWNPEDPTRIRLVVDRRPAEMDTDIDTDIERRVTRRTGPIRYLEDVRDAYWAGRALDELAADCDVDLRTMATWIYRD